MVGSGQDEIVHDPNTALDVDLLGRDAAIDSQVLGQFHACGREVAGIDVASEIDVANEGSLLGPGAHEGHVRVLACVVRIDSE